MHLMEIREKLEKREESLNSFAAKSINAKRDVYEEPCKLRTAFQRDRDRILHSKSFRRLKHKTQVFIKPGGDHYRTRLTHTLEVSQISRTIAKALELNEELTEAIALGHDLGHTPFGHTGERILNEISDNGFKHYVQSKRVVEKLENNGKGLNLSTVVRDGILKHSKGEGAIIPENRNRIPITLEGQIVRISDIIAYTNHDIDDAKRAEIIVEKDIPNSVHNLLGSSFSERIGTIVESVVNESLKKNLEIIAISEDIYSELTNLRSFLFDRVYRNSDLEREREKVENILLTIFDYVKRDPDRFINFYPESDSVKQRIIDFIAGMTDNYAIGLFKKITLI